MTEPPPASVFASHPLVDVSVLFDAHDYKAGVQWVPSETELQYWVHRAMQMSESRLEKSELSIGFASKEFSRELNQRYRGKNQATNVLSFPAEMPALPLDDGSGAHLRVLGDVVMCPEVIAEEALQQHKSVREHFAHMTVHGVLHLCGYDHIKSAEASAMESVEIQILSVMGIADPYGIRTNIVS